MLSANTNIAKIALLRVESEGLLILCQNSLVVMPKFAVELGINKHCLDAEFVVIRTKAQTISHAVKIRYKMQLYFYKNLLILNSRILI